MPADDIEVYAICHREAISPGEAKAFSLFRRYENGEARPFSIFVIRKSAREYVGYVNVCPHNRTWLNISSGGFLTADRARIACSRHRAEFDIESGTCLSGPCEGASLEPLALTIIAGDVCLCGVSLVEDESVREEPDETMEISIHPE